MKRIIALGIVLTAIGMFTAPASAGLAASGVMTATPDGADWKYSIMLTDTGTTTIGTFWYSWIPGQGYLPTLPSDFTAPAGWVKLMTDGPPPTDGYSIRFVNTSSPLMPGQSAVFGFESASSPSTLAGLSAIHPSTPIGTSFVYSEGPFSDAGQRFVVTSAVPEPSTLTLGFLGLASLAALRLRRKVVA